jgi:uncharacterized membrane protein YdbT with pleckstrin-like domain
MITFRENEKIHLIRRRHKFVLWKGAFPMFLVFLIIMVLGTVLLFSSVCWPDWMIDFLPGLAGISLKSFLLFTLSLLFLIFWVALFVAIATYYLDCWIVTSERTIHTELKSLFNRVLSTVQHDRIQDITVEVRGILPTFFRYGDLHIQTAGGFRSFVFREVPEPHQTKEIIFKAQSEFLERRRGRHQHSGGDIIK